MIKQKGLIFLVSLFLCSFSFATELVSKIYELKPGISQVVENPLWWRLSVHCTMSTRDSEDILIGTMKKNSASLNGVLLKESESTTVLVKNNDTLFIVSEALAQVEITNIGQSIVEAKCST